MSSYHLLQSPVDTLPEFKGGMSLLLLMDCFLKQSLFGFYPLGQQRLVGMPMAGFRLSNTLSRFVFC